MAFYEARRGRNVLSAGDFSLRQDVEMVTPNQPMLRILRGKSQYPLRAIDQSQFLIGAGSSCQIQLSAGEIPMIFAVLRFDDEGCCLVEAMHSEPAMIVNGTRQRSASLRHGDRVAIGSYEFEFLSPPGNEGQKSLKLDDFVAAQPNIPYPLIIPQVPADLSALSAEELVDRIERELELLELLGEFDDLPTGSVTDQAHPRKTA